MSPVLWVRREDGTGKQHIVLMHQGESREEGWVTRKQALCGRRFAKKVSWQAEERPWLVPYICRTCSKLLRVL